MITVRLPSTLEGRADHTLEVHEPVATIAALVDVIDRRIPGFRDQLDDSVFNFAVNDEMLLFRAHEHALKDGDVVEVIPTISGGAPSDEGDGEDRDREQNPDQRVRVTREVQFERCLAKHDVFRPFEGLDGQHPG